MLGRVWKRGGAAIAAVFIVSLLAGCSTPAAPPAPTPTAAAVAPSPTTSQASALDQVRDEYVQAGGQCERITRRNLKVAEEAGDCNGGALLSTYSSTSQRDTAIATLEGAQATTTRPGYVIAVGDGWIVNGPDAGTVAAKMGGTTRMIGTPAPSTSSDLTTDEGLCAADADMTNLELNDAIAPLLGYPADRDARTADQDQAIRDYKNAAFERACPARAG